MGFSLIEVGVDERSKGPPNKPLAGMKLPVDCINYMISFNFLFFTISSIIGSSSDDQVIHLFIWDVESVEIEVLNLGNFKP